MCPCTFAIPHGEGNAATFVQFHVDRAHKRDYPRGVSRADAGETIKHL